MASLVVVELRVEVGARLTMLFSVLSSDRLIGVDSSFFSVASELKREGRSVAASRRVRLLP